MASRSEKINAKLLKSLSALLTIILVSGVVPLVSPSGKVSADGVHWTHERDYFNPESGDLWNWYDDGDIRWLSLESDIYDYFCGDMDHLPDADYKPADYPGTSVYYILEEDYTCYMGYYISDPMTITIDLNGNDLYLYCNESFLILNGQVNYNITNSSSHPSSIIPVTSEYSRTDGDGGFFYVTNGATLSITNVSIAGGCAESGGAIAIGEGGTVRLTNCEVTDCDARDRGSAICIENGGTLILTNTEITDNYYGTGAVYTAGTVNLMGKNVINTSGNYYDGSLYIVDGHPATLYNNAPGSDVLISGSNITEGSKVLNIYGAGLTGYKCANPLYDIGTDGCLKKAEIGNIELEGCQVILNKDDSGSIVVRLFCSVPPTLINDAVPVVTSDDYDVSYTYQTDDTEGYIYVDVDVDYIHMTSGLELDFTEIDEGYWEAPEDPISVRDYAMTVINDTNNRYTDADKEMVIALLNFGTYMQVYFNFNTSDLANKDLTTAQKNKAFLSSAEYSSIPIPDYVPDGEHLSYYGTSVLVRADGDFQCYNYIELLDEADRSKVTFDRISDGYVLYASTRYNDNPKFVCSESRYYDIFCLENVDGWVVYYDGQIELEFEYCLLDYIALVYNYYQGDTKIYNLARSLYTFYTVAQDYKGGNGDGY